MNNRPRHKQSVKRALRRGERIRRLIKKIDEESAVRFNSQNNCPDECQVTSIIDCLKKCLDDTCPRLKKE